MKPHFARIWMFLALLYVAALLTAVFVHAADELPPVPAGRRLEMHADSDGTPPLTFTWYKDGVQVFVGNPLVFDPVKPEHAGSYTVRSENSKGSAISPPDVLRVGPAKVGPPIVIKLEVAP